MRFLCLFALGFFIGFPREAVSQSPQVPDHQPSSAAPDPQSEPGTASFRITTREVAVDLIALHGRNQPVLDLTPAELLVSEELVVANSNEKHGRHKTKSAEPGTAAEPGAITALHAIDPNEPLRNPSESREGFQITTSCLERSTQHYRLTFRPGSGGWRSGYHRVMISTTRQGVKLYYRHQYYVGLTEGAPRPPFLTWEAMKKVLLQAACYYPQTPPSILLRARFVDSGQADVLRYAVSIDADSLSMLTLAGQNPAPDAATDRQVALDFAICNFDSRGLPINFFHAPLEKVLTSADYARALDRGFPHVLEFPAPEHLALTRVVVRDRASGNLGATDVLYPRPEQASKLQASAPGSADVAAATKIDLEGIAQLRRFMEFHQEWPMLHVAEGPIGSFGSIVPNPRLLCGDVYELPAQTPNLPDFRELDPIGSIYASSFDVPNQNFSNTSGIPGMTPRTNLFGIDYHGVFWVTAPGRYEFQMLSDDGAILQIDDEKVIDLDGLHTARPGTGAVDLSAGRHTMEIPYYQGAVVSVALELWVKPPGAQSWTIFDLNDYRPQPATDGGSSTHP